MKESFFCLALKNLGTWCLTRCLLKSALPWPPVTLLGMLGSFLTKIYNSVCILNKYVGLLLCICTISQKLETCCIILVLKNEFISYILVLDWTNYPLLSSCYQNSLKYLWVTAKCCSEYCQVMSLWFFMGILAIFFCRINIFLIYNVQNGDVQ